MKTFSTIVLTTPFSDHNPVFNENLTHSSFKYDIRHGRNACINDLDNKKLKLQSAPLINGSMVNKCNPNTTDLRRCIMAQRQP